MADLRQELYGRVDADAATGLEVSTGVGTNIPPAYDLVIRKGADWSLKVTWFSQPNTPEDLTGATASLIIRDAPDGTALVTLTEVSGLTLSTSSTAPSVTASIATATVNAYTWGPRATYLLTVTNGGVTTALLCGAVVLRGL